MNEFEHLLLSRCLTPHRLLFAMNRFVEKCLGEKFLAPPSMQFELIFERSTSSIPIIFILSSGSDPTIELQKLAERKLPASKSLRILAMGQGQEKFVLQALQMAQHQGAWILIQNCHLLVSFLNEFEKFLDIKSHVSRKRTSTRIVCSFLF